MSGAVAVLRREVAERWLLFAGAAMLGLLPLAAPLLPGGYKELRGDMAVLLGQILSGLLALTLGATVVSRDLAEGRLSFYFSRPLSGGALWAGKFAGAALLTCACGLLATLPGWLAAGWGSSKVDFTRLFSWGLVVLSLLFLAHASGVLLRERSVWLLLDFLAFCGVAMLISITRANSMLSGTGVYEQIFWPGLAAAITILAVASAAQLLAGRSDLRRSRRLLSLWLWLPLLMVATGFAVYSYRAIQAEPRDLAQAEVVVSAPTGPWVAVTGPVAGLPDYHPGLLVDTHSGRSILLPESMAHGGVWYTSPAFSADGRRVVFAKIQKAQSLPDTLFSLDLDRPGAEPILLSQVGQMSSKYSPFLALSPDGRYLAQRANGRLLIDDLAAGRLVATLQLPPFWYSEEIRFLGNGVLRFFSVHSQEEEPPGGWYVRVPDLDLKAGEPQPPMILRQTGPLRFRPSPDGRRLLLWTRGDVFRLHDAATGKVLADLAPGGQDRRATYLADGRPLLVLPHPRGTELLIFQADGSGEPRRHLLAGVQSLGVGGQPSPASLVLTTSTEKVPPYRWQAVQLDLETGRSRTLAKGLVPIGAPGAIPGPGSPASRLFRRNKALVLLDFATGREQILTGEGAVQR